MVPMSEIENVLSEIRLAAEAVGIPVLAAEAGVPLTTVRSYAERGWTHKNLAVIQSLSAAAKRLHKPDKAA